MKQTGVFIVHVAQIGLGYAIAVPLFLFIQATNLFWKIVEGKENG
jgi:hypothetical protein